MRKYAFIIIELIMEVVFVVSLVIKKILYLWCVMEELFVEFVRNLVSGSLTACDFVLLVHVGY